MAQPISIHSAGSYLLLPRTSDSRGLYDSRDNSADIDIVAVALPDAMRQPGIYTLDTHHTATVNRDSGTEYAIPPMIRQLITLIMLAILMSQQTMHAVATERPRLVLGIVIDQLQTDYLEYLSPLMVDNGFNTLIRKGLYIRNLDFEVPRPDAASATTQLYTGAYPASNGVESATMIDRTRRHAMPLFGAARVTPQPILLSTITDELAIDGLGLGQIYSIAAIPEIAIPAGGHTPTAAIWLDYSTGKWVTSRYYTATLPQPVMARNTRHSLPQRIDTMAWRPLLELKEYPGLPRQKKHYPFRHYFGRSNTDAYANFAKSPLANREVTDIAIELIKTLHLGGSEGGIDMLNIGYSLAPYKGNKDGDYRLELQDAYLRMDRDLARLLQAARQAVGTGELMVFILPTGYFDDATAPDEKYRIPGGTLSTKKAAALLNAYLGANFGNTEYIDVINGGKIYLNGKALQRARSTTGRDPLVEAREFLSKMSGVASVITLSDILDADTPYTRSLLKAILPANAPDLLLEPQPGWRLVDDYTLPVTERLIRLSPIASPAIIMTTAQKPAVISTPVEAIRIAPTITRLLRLRAPNGAAAQPLDDK